MPNQTRIVRPGPTPDTVVTEQKETLRVPPGWERLPPGAAGLARRGQSAGPSWTGRMKLV